MDTQVTKDILATASLTDSYMLLILAIMIISGILGGLANYFLSEKSEKPAQGVILKYSFLGMAAALTTPFFLNMISSNMLETARTKPLNFLVFSGFCLVFAFFSCRFLENIYTRRLQKTEASHKEIIRPEEATREPEKTEKAVSKGKLTRGGISEDDLKIMSMLIEDEKQINRSLDELLKNTDISREKFNEILSLLMAKGLVGQKLDKGNTLVFSLTPQGKQILDKFSEK